MVHKHSEAAEQRRLARKIVLKDAFIDPIRQETVNIMGPEQVSALLSQNFEYVLPEAASHVERGEVLLDSRGQGSFQERTPSER
jgi:hypothetical protein